MNISEIDSLLLEVNGSEELLYNASNATNVTAISYYEGSVTVLTMYCLLFVIAAVGNLTVFVSLFRTRHRKSRVSLMIMHLTIGDLVVTFIMIPLEVGWRITVQWMAGNIACKVLVFFKAFGLYLSSNVLVCVSLDRYFAVLHPLRVNGARRRGKCMLIWAWVVSLICAIPQSIVFHLDSPPHDPNFVQCVTFGFFKSDFQQTIYNLFGVTVMYFIPLIAITVAYTAILWTISKKSKETNQESQSRNGTSKRMTLRRSDMSNIERARTRTLRMTITIVVVFVICWTPYVFITLWYSFDTNSVKKIPHWIQDSLFMMAVSNSCMNPLVYGSYAINVKRDCLSWCCCYKRSSGNQRNQSAFVCSGQNMGLTRRLFRCLCIIQKVGSGVTRTTGTIRGAARSNNVQLNGFGPPTQQSTKIPEFPRAIRYKLQSPERQSHHVTFYSEPCCSKDAHIVELSHNSDTQVIVHRKL